MSVVESSRILQPESKHSIKADVCDPDEGERYNRRAIRPERVNRQHQWPHVGVDGVVRDRSHPSSGGVAEHREIRQKKQQGKLKPTAVTPVVREEADDQYCGTFWVQKWSRVHGVLLSGPKRAARVITTALLNESGETGIYYDEAGRPMLGSALVRDPKFQESVVAETRALLSTIPGQYGVDKQSAIVAGPLSRFRPERRTP